MAGLPNHAHTVDYSVIPLSGLVNNTDNTPYVDDTYSIDYHSSITTSAIMQGCVDTDVKGIRYRVEARNARGNLARPNPLYRVDTSMPVSEEVRCAFQDMCKRSSALPTTWERLDLHGLVVRLTKGIAAYSLWGALTAVELRGGGNVSCTSIASVIGPIAADCGALFISAKLAGRSRPNVLAALINAASGEGSSVYTDLLGVGVDGVVQVPNAQNAALAQGCHEAIRILGAQFKACGKTAFFGLAVAEGWHSVKSLHGHTDEGAYVRDVFRACESGLPYGAIMMDTVPDNSIPTPQRSVSGFRSVYDAIGIATAGGVALADPMVNVRGRDFPTTLVTDQGDEADPGDDDGGDAADAMDLSTQWAENCGAWAVLYAKFLNALFLGKGGEDEVCRRLTTQANSLAGRDNRHLRMKCAVAFFYVEPTTACPIYGPEYPAAVGRHGPLATRMQPGSMPMLDGCRLLVDSSDATRSSIQADIRYLRRQGMFIHLTQHARDGMANVILETAVANDLAFIGGAGAIQPRILAGNPLSHYQWIRGHSSVVSGGEFITLSETNIITLDHTRRVGGGRRLRLNHLPTGLEAVSGDVSIFASSLSGGAPAVAGAGAGGAGALRARTRAAIALSMAADAGRTHVIHNAQRMAPSLIDPGPLPSASSTIAAVRQAEVPVRQAGAVMAGVPVVAAVDVAGRVGAAPAGAQVRGVAAPINIEHARDRGPRAPRPGRIGAALMPGGGGGGGGLGGALLQPPIAPVLPLPQPVPPQPPRPPPVPPQPPVPPVGPPGGPGLVEPAQPLGEAGADNRGGGAG